MASLEYFNNVVSIHEIFYDNSKTLIEKILIDLDKPELVDEMIEKYLDSTIRLKAKKDPNRPKRPINSYTFFCKEHRDKIKDTNPDIGFKELNKQLGKMWNELTEEKKEKYIILGKSEKERYRYDMEEYEENKLY